MGLSKSKYTIYCQCEKYLWLNEYRSELKNIDPTEEEVLRNGNIVGDLAMGLLGEYVEVTTYNSGLLDLKEMVRKTREEIAKGTLNICEASFFYLDNYCAVDILHNDGDGYSIYEVKSSTKVEDYHIKDVSYQKYVLEKNGLKVNRCYLVHINPFYVRKKELDIKGLFKIEDITEMVRKETSVEKNIINAREVLKNSIEPSMKISEKCLSPFKCPFYTYCHQNIPENSVFSLYRMTKKKMYDYYHKGIVTYDDIKNNNIKLNQIQKYQIDGNELIVDKEELSDFLKNFKYPIYFLDFETMQEAIPPYENSKPYSQIPFQYSLHILYENGNLEHKEFLGDGINDPRLDITKSLCENIPLDVVLVAYNKSFECTRLKELAELYPEYSKHLLNIRDNIVDLIDPFQKGYVYKKEMNGSMSIKKVLPAFFKDDKTLDYHELPGVQNGKEAMQAYARLKELSLSECQEVRKGLLEYCKLDTLAMVKLYEKLKKL